jgi:hypothetical protein
MDGRTEVVAAPTTMAPLPPNPTHPAVRFELTCPDGRADWAPALIVSEVTPAVTFKQTREFVRVCAQPASPSTLPPRPHLAPSRVCAVAPLVGWLAAQGALTDASEEPHRADSRV